MMRKFKNLKLYSVICLVVVMMLILGGCAQDAKQAEETETPKEDSWPEREIKIMVPFGPGGSGDRYTMALKPQLEEALGKPVIIDYKEGAGTQIGYEMLHSQEADGYTIGLLSIPHINNTIILQDSSYELEDFYPLGTFTSIRPIFFAGADSKWNDITEVIEYAKDHPEELTVAVGALTGEQYLALVMLEEQAGIKFSVVPTGGGAKVATGVLGGHYDLGVTRAPALLGVSDEIKGLAILAPERDPNFPDTKTFDEQLSDGLDLQYVTVTYGLVARKELKDKYPERFKKLADAFEKAARSEEFGKVLEGDGSVMEYKTPDEAWDNMLQEQKLYEEYKDSMEQ